MSADNYIYIRQRADGLFGVSMRFKSDEWEDATPELQDKEDRHVLNSWHDAVATARKWESRLEVCEYGIIVEPELRKIVNDAMLNAVEQCDT